MKRARGQDVLSLGRHAVRPLVVWLAKHRYSHVASRSTASLLQEPAWSTWCLQWLGARRAQGE